MDSYQEMWNEFKQRLQLADAYSLRRDITYQHVLALMASYEEHYTPPTSKPEPEEGG